MSKIFGEVQDELLSRARRSKRGFVYPQNYRERRSAQALARRGILEQAVSWPSAYRLVKKF